jgi:hypothetical protein
LFAGSLETGTEDDHIHAITPAEMPLSAALPRTTELLEAAVSKTFAAKTEKRGFH